jgi:hypothetical protein
MSGKYRDAVELLRPLVDARVLKDRIDQQESLRIYGTALFLSGARAGGERAFRDLLRIEGKTELDPAFVRPEVVRFFDEVKQRYQQELIAEAKRRGPRGSAVANLLPPWGQFQNGQRVKGWLLGGAELVLSTTSVVTAALLWTWRDDKGQFGSREGLAGRLQIVNYVSFFSLVAVLAYGVLDGLYHYYRGPRGLPPPGQDKLALERGLGLRF